MYIFRKLTLILILRCSIVFGLNIALARTLTMAVNIGVPPYVYVDTNGIITGFDVELIRAVGKLKGFDITIVPAVFPQVFDELKNKKVDFIGNVFYSEERSILYNLTVPHYIDKIKLLTLADKNIVNPFAAGNTVATLSFSPIEEIFQKNIHADYPLLKMRPEFTTYLGFKDLFINRANVLLATESNIRMLTGKYHKFKYRIFDLPSKYQQNIAISFLTRKDNQSLVNMINSGIQMLKDNGTYSQLRKKYQL